MPTQNTLREWFDYKGGNLFWRKKTSNRARLDVPAGSVQTFHSGIYRVIRFNNKLHLAHRLVWVYHNGDIPDEMMIDHINHNGLDNTIQNLRMVTRSQNQRNQKMNKKNTSGVTGVVRSPNKKRWIAQMSFRKDGIRRHLHKTFDTFDEAVSYRKHLEVSYGFHPNHGSAC